MMGRSRQVIQKGSKSFFLASLFFDSETKRSCWDLYQWCRYCDDLIDHSVDPLQSLHKLYQDWQSYPNCSEPFRLVRKLESKYQIPETYFLGLLKGFEMDVQGFQFQEIRDVEMYSYYVAGTVGLQMSYIMGVSDTRAYSHAVDLGIAMQLTNIARDIKDDYERGRVYLPKSWLAEAGLDVQTLFDPSSDLKLYQVVLRLLNHADRFYRSGYEGLVYLPWRAALAVSIAGRIYSRIGDRIRKGGVKSLQRRTVVSLPEKMICAVHGAVAVMPLLLWRGLRPWRRVSFQKAKEVS